MPAFDRRAFLSYCSAAGLGSTLFPGALVAEAKRAVELENETPPAFVFDPRVSGVTPPLGEDRLVW